MKILWIVNTPLGILCEKLYSRKESGLWMEALLDSFQNVNNYQLIIATTAKIDEIKKYEQNGVIYYALPNQIPLLYDENKSQNIAAWKQLLEVEKPDLIQVWGTEFTHGLCALREAKGAPSIIYMQGYLGSIARYYLAGITHSELNKSVTFRDLLKLDWIEAQQKKYYVATAKEKEMLQLSGRVIIENEWCYKCIKSIVPEIKAYHCPLSVSKAFSEFSWNISNAEPHSIICTASGYPLKGLHMVLRAVALLKQKYPDIRLYVPGPKMISDGSLQWKIRKRGYTKYIEHLIQSLDIEKQIIWLGQLTQERLAEQYSKTRVFVLSSSIENHSSSLKEAMMVGTPSIAAAVGGIPEYVRHDENGFLYRFEEYEIMAQYIERIFEDGALAQRVSASARTDMITMHSANNIFEIITRIYEKMLEE